jgi:Flp pilus assembly protein TadD
MFVSVRTKGINVLPMVNKGLALFQSKQDAASAIKLCEEALTIDPENEAAVATLAQLNLQQGNVVEALKMFNRHCELARTEPELTNALTYKYVSASESLSASSICADADITRLLRLRSNSLQTIQRWLLKWDKLHNL